MVLSYGIAAVAALLSGLAYAELAVDMPLAGGAFSCILAVFTEPLAWLVNILPSLIFYPSCLSGALHMGDHSKTLRQPSQIIAIRVMRLEL